MPHYRISLSGMPSSALVRWLQALIPVLREAPNDCTITVAIERPDPESPGVGWDEAA